MRTDLALRNLLGGFLGGILGILFFELVYPAMLPIGCLIGVAAGALYREIWATVVAFFRKSSASVREMTVRCEKAVSSGCLAVRGFHHQFVAFIVKASAFAWKCIRVFFWLITLRFVFSRFVPWLQRHPMNRMHAIQWMAGASVALAMTSLLLFAMSFRRAHEFLGPFHAKWQDGITVALLLLFACFCFGAIAAAYVSNKQDYDGMSDFHREFETYARFGTAGYFMRFAVCIMMACLTVISGAIFLLAGAFVAGIAFVMFLFLIPMLAIAAIKAARYLAEESKMWLCLGVTILATSLCAWVMSPYLADPAWLWISALAAGTVSGLASEGSRRLVAWSFARYDKLDRLAERPAEDSLKPVWSGYWKIAGMFGELVTDRIGSRFCN